MSVNLYDRAIWLVPPGAVYDRHEIRASKLTVFYRYAGVKNPSFVSVPL